MTRFEREVIVVVGKTGHGKTLWTRRHVIGQKRVIILDPMLEYEGTIFDNLEDMIDHIKEHKVYQVRTEFAQDAKWLAMIAMSAGQCLHPGTPMPHRGCTDVTLVIDEAGRAIPSRQLIDPAIEDVIYRGRHRHVTMINVVQRASTLSIAARSQWTRLVSFWQTESADVKWIQDQAGSKLAIDDLAPLDYYDITPWGVRKKHIEVDENEDKEISQELERRES